MDEITIEVRTRTNREGQEPLYTAEIIELEPKALQAISAHIDSWVTDSPAEMKETSSAYVSAMRMAEAMTRDLIQRAANCAAADRSPEIAAEYAELNGIDE